MSSTGPLGAGLGGALLMLVLLAGCGERAADGDSEVQRQARNTPGAAAGETSAAEGVSLKPEEVRDLGIEVTDARSATHAPEGSGFGVVSAHEAIAQSLSELIAAEAAERQSRAALARGQRLAGTPGAMAAEALEAAQRQATVDEAAALLARRRLSAAFGQNPPWGEHIEGPLLRALASGATKLVRVTFPLGTLEGEETPRELRLARIADLASGTSWPTQAVWSAPADPNVPGTSFFALLAGTTAREGERLVARVALGAPATGALVPASALVISDNRYWCYVERKPGVFVRIELDTRVPVDHGYFVREGIAPGDQVVSAAAGRLLARETASAAAAD